MSIIEHCAAVLLHTKHVEPDRKDRYRCPLPALRPLGPHPVASGLSLGTPVSDRTTDNSGRLGPQISDIGQGRGPVRSWAQGQLFRSGSPGKLDLQFPAKLAFVRGLYCRDKQSPFGRTAKKIAPVRVL